jgi:hypothetical protein
MLRKLLRMPKDFVLPDAVCKAARRVCNKDAFLDRIRDDWFSLQLIATSDREYGRASLEGDLRKHLTKGERAAQGLIDWLGEGPISEVWLGPVYFAAFQGGDLEEKEAATAAIVELRRDIEGVQRLHERMAAEVARLKVVVQPSRTKGLGRALAKLTRDLYSEFDLGVPTPSTNSNAVKLMNAIAKSLGVENGSGSDWLKLK